MSGAHLEDAALERVQFTDCRLLGVQAAHARLRHVALTRVAAPLSVWVKADAAHLRLDDCDLTEAAFMDADLPGLILRACRLPRTDLRGLRITPRELEGVTVDATQLPDLAHLLGVRVGESLPEPDALP
ncbi:pentapeptide repeat-containing protein [Deinococcus sp. 14RED07]|uniref:pentapeptide repeat-containing protein n=1 Tax=Deinococcus sp. 14RED07 TaxID=2745874 RepID=UPI001E3DE4DD|nr:pentapeptide repeat-containing protein [Deinococcus sp. 14RED07]MCD0174946.1 pentapeptide repeat-containing protein [Deinococcus sp. 14RED07]